jgi:hypothetical protein
MTEDDDAWLLVQDGEVVAEIEIDGADQPWLHGRLLPRPGFAAARALLDRQEELMGASPMDSDAVVDVYDRINAALTLLTPDGPAAEFWLQTREDRVWLRFSDEPLDP